MAHNTALIAASAGHRPKLSLSRLSSDTPNKSNNRHSRISSTLSLYFDAEDNIDGVVEEGGEGERAERVEPNTIDEEEGDEDSAPLSGYDSSSALILVHDDSDQDEVDSPFPFSDSDNEDQDSNQRRLEFSPHDAGIDEDVQNLQFPLRPTSLILPPLPPSLVFLHLITPYLRLGALNLPYGLLPLKYGLPALLLSALTAVFVRQVWYMLARYLRKASLTEVVVDTFARSHGGVHGRREREKEKRRVAIRVIARMLVGVLGVLVSVVYLRHAMYTLYPVIARDKHPVSSYVLSTALLSIPLLYLSSARTLNYRRITYATWLSLFTYLAWLACILYAHSKGVLQPNSGWLGSIGVVPGLATTIFSFCSPSTLALYTSLKSGLYSFPSYMSSSTSTRSFDKASYLRSFRFLSISSVALAMLLLLPSTIFSAFPNLPEPSSYPIQDPHRNATAITNSTLSKTSLLSNTTVPIIHAQPIITLPLSQVQIHPVIRILSASTLLLSIPSVLVSTPPPMIPTPLRLRSVKANLSRILVFVFIVVLACIPPTRLPPKTQMPDDKNDQKEAVRHFFLSSESPFFQFLSLSMVIMAYLGTYIVPCVLHVSQHFFKRPLAIVVPRSQTRTGTLALSVSDGGNRSSAEAGTSSHNASPPRAQHDELLLRKERALQKRQLKRRIVWDIGVWAVLLAGVSGAAVFGVWAFNGCYVR